MKAISPKLASVLLVKDSSELQVVASYGMEGLVGAYRLAEFAGDDLEPLLEAMMLSAGFQMRCQFNQYNSIYLPNPRKAMGGFARSIDNFEIRIDYVQHALSAMIAYEKFFAPETPAPSIP